jgi:hypothetical protein
MRREELMIKITSNIKINKNKCWIWQGSNSGNPADKKSGRGYGRMSVNGYTSAVHRIMFVCVNGYIPNKMQVDHICVERLCCNPDHLQLVSHKKNCKLRDKRRKK